ncbi:hypothetical protein K432DRAFT_289795 [Lepidopterella palustris CBS 459.81]|uniref:DUF6594 domain-containing protein n=1 Tax=Lepidopterella palustris CBS 459.81 TaxID=1314670 RepID=A0A8E2JJ65_9PEZI|nr:hypothetical protein K432DRAFT_289795 [Lepidopterella palustris CBS 459.81]
MDLEVANRKPYPLTGFPSLAAFIASDQDKTAAIFKRFNRLAARNLLHLQSGLAELQAKQDELDEQELRGSLQSKQFSRNWADFCTAATSDPRQKERKELAEHIRATLKEYREALLFESTLAALPPPSKRTLRAFRWHFFNGDPAGPSSFPTLGGQSSTLFDDISDLVVLRAPEDQDRLTTFVQSHMNFLFRQTSTRNGMIAYASGRLIGHFVATLSIFLAAVLLIGAIVALYIVRSPKRKLGIVAGFTVGFAGSVGLLTNARRAEVFGATAAYAAVLVVFVSGNLGGEAGSAGLGN